MIAVGVIVAFIQSTAAIFPRRDALREGAEGGCTQGDQKACQEMYATIRAANAADDIVDLAIWQFVAGLVGVYLIARTLKATRDAVKEANDATTAAQLSVEVAQKTLQNDRAWMTWSGVEPTNLEGGLRLQAKWENTGRSPALEVRCFTHAKLVIATEPVPVFETQLPDDMAGPVGAGKYTLAYAPHIPMAQWGLVKAGPMDLYLMSCVSYRDIFSSVVRESVVVVRLTYEGVMTHDETGETKMVVRTRFVGSQTRNT